jgi:hypothetical protein
MPGTRILVVAFECAIVAHSFALLLFALVRVDRGPRAIEIAIPASPPATIPSIVPIVMPIPVSTPVAPVARASCPVPVRDAPDVRVDEARVPIAVEHVRPSRTNARWIAAWNEERAIVSRDGGARWTEVLDGPGAIADVAFDCFGRALVLRGIRLGVRDDDGERWLTVPGLRELADRDDPRALVGDGPDLVVLGIASDSDAWLARLAISSDGGAAWRWHDLAESYEERKVSAYEDAAGTIRIAISTADCMSDDLYWYVIDRDGVARTRWDRSPGPFAIQRDAIVGPFLLRPLAERGDDVSFEHGYGVSGTPLDGPFPRIVGSDFIVYRVDGGRAVPLRPVPEGVELRATDASGRLWGVRKSVGTGMTVPEVIDGRRAPIPKDPAADI